MWRDFDSTSLPGTTQILEEGATTALVTAKDPVSANEVLPNSGQLISQWITDLAACH